MKVNRITLAAITVLILVLSIPVSAVPENSINWKSYDEGVAMAKEQGKKAVVFFSASWCSYCAKMKKTTFQNDEVIQYLNENYIPIMVNSDKEREIVSSYNVRGLPTLWFLKEDGTGLTMRPGYVDAKSLMIMMKYLYTDSYLKMKYEDFLKSL